MPDEIQHKEAEREMSKCTKRSSPWALALGGGGDDVFLVACGKEERDYLGKITRTAWTEYFRLPEMISNSPD